ncbi:MAG: VWA domain-containing protein [Candidatus Aminicenantes bacterium]|nr:MAG: VWA domain-containing protein [Candidatus Aminicenantes bacterium]
MSFTHPEAFFLLIALALFIGIAAHNYKKKKIILKGFISTAAYKKMGVRSGGEIDFFKTSLVIAAMLFFILALAGPQWGERFENVDIKGIEMVFLLDTSNSMNAEDLKPNRLEVAKQLIISIVDNLQTDYLALINFAGAAYVQCPLTIDYEAFKLLAAASLISPQEEQGTDFLQAFLLTLKSLENSKSDKKIMILITDGEDQEGQWQAFMPEIKKQNIIIFTVGVGATSGAPIPKKDKDGNIVGWKKDKQGNIVKTRLDENTLIRIASQTGGQYFRLTDAAGIDTFVNNLKTFERKVLRKKVKSQKIKRFHYPLIIGIIILLLELLLTERKLSWKEK